MKTLFVLALGPLVFACSSGGDGNDAGGTDASTDTTMTSDASDASTQSDGDATTCATPIAPTTSDGGIYCPYQDSGAPTCTGMMQQCCVPTTGSSTCSMMPCGINVGLQCAESNDCMGGMVCCLSGVNDVHQDPGCTSYYAVTMSQGTMCGPMCPPNVQAQVCGSDGDCTGGKSCKPLLIDRAMRPIWLGACIAADGGF